MLGSGPRGPASENATFAARDRRPLACLLLLLRNPLAMPDPGRNDNLVCLIEWREPSPHPRLG
ncbi:MAG: hypothetical protein ACRDN0_39310 [Trebonia sp.]